MGLKLWISEYELHLRAHGVRRGALIRLEESGIGVGFADCHPWVERGDLPLHQQLKMLAVFKQTPLTERTLFFARIDAAARKAGRGLFEGLTIPKSHWLVMKCDAHLSCEIESAAAHGFELLKIKIGDSENDIKHLDEVVPLLQKLNLKLRLDANGKFNADQFEALLSKCSASLHERIDFLEDPTPFHAKEWSAISKTFGVRLARDLGDATEWILESAAKSTVVLKPAIENPLPILPTAIKRQSEVVITSYLDHPLGQLGAAYSAAVALRNSPDVISTCGLASHLVYESNTFSEQLNLNGSVLVPPKGTGFGFDDELDKLSWTRLS
ncbi:MAG: hypothetical protein HY540_08100 [Deltaproteobacteria bacterium]|nr:hypothetical protein [Deltaproteobacteria bacterium]